MEKKRTILNAIDYIMAFAKKEDMANYYTAPSKNTIRRADFSGIGRVWNDGHGFLQLADFNKDEILYLNQCLLSKSEIKQLEERLQAEKIAYVIVFFGYPDYYSKGLTQMEPINKK